jgi:predicted RNase H-like HicB family nuclease
MANVDYDSSSGQFVMTCPDCPTVSAADTEQEAEADRQYHEAWHAVHP